MGEEVAADTTLVGQLLPPRVMSAELFGDVLPGAANPEAALFPEEEAVIACSVEKRRREFTTVRVCARRALSALGFGPVAIVPGLRGAPGWPPGVVGSMTHCDGYRACVVAAHADVAALGIDAEPHGPLPEGVLPLVTLPAERDALRKLTVTCPGIFWDRVIFAAKEAVYKAWFPLTQQYLDFSEAHLELSPDGCFTAHFLVPGPVLNEQRLEAFAGRWLVQDGLVVTAIAHRAAAVNGHRSSG
jgi:4'-phosphopantetheinyl transferase EntD